MADTGISEREIVKVLVSIRALAEVNNIPAVKLNEILARAREGLQGK